jgi:hypothetical protein
MYELILPLEWFEVWDVFVWVDWECDGIDHTKYRKEWDENKVYNWYALANQDTFIIVTP